MRVPLCSVILIHYVTKVVIDDVILTKKSVAVCRTRTSSSFGLTYLIHGTLEKYRLQNNNYLHSLYSI